MLTTSRRFSLSTNCIDWRWTYELVLMRDHYRFELLGETLDDAVGEHDKVGRVMGLAYLLDQ